MRTTLMALEERLAEPTAKALAAAVIRGVRDGVIVPGDRLPPIREVARELTMSPTTVSAAWSLLQRAGTVRTQGRLGTLVTDAATSPGRYRRVLDRPGAFDLDLSSGVPDPALLPPLDPVLGALRQPDVPHAYLDAPVLPELAQRLRASWPYAAPALTVVDGAMDGLDLVIRTQLRFGDRVVVEHPSFPPLLDLLESAGISWVGVQVDASGLVVQSLAEALRDTSVRAVFLQPRAQNPTGVSTTPARLAELAAVLASGEVLLVEDDSSDALCDTPPLSLGAVLPERTVHVRSFSKSHGPDLRLAALSGPADVVEAIERFRQLGQGWSSRLLQQVLLALLDDPTTAARVDAARTEYRRRRRVFVETLAGEGVEVGGSDGLNVWVPVADESAALLRLAAQGIGVAPGSPFRVLADDGDHVRVTVGLIDGDVEDVALRVAEASRTGRWPAGVR